MITIRLLPKIDPVTGHRRELDADLLVMKLTVRLPDGSVVLVSPEEVASIEQSAPKR